MADPLDTVRSTLLAASPTLGVGTRIYPNLMPDDATLPSIVLQVVGVVAEYDLAGPAGLDQAVVQVECHASTYGAAKSLAADVRTTLDAADMILSSEMRDYDPGTETHSVIQDWFVWYAPA
jgi:hypothetical protein